MLNLQALSPFGPIFGKELRTTARRKRTYILRVAYLGGLLLLLLMTYSSTRPSQSFSVAYRQQQQAEMGYAFFCCFSMFCVISMAVIAPVLTATAISSEREHKTLHVLLMTPINSWQIISGKLFSRLLAALSLIGLSLPALAVARLLGGVELNQMFAVLCICTVTALSSAAIGLFYSTLLKRAYAVILLSYATQAVLYLFVPFLVVGVAAASGSRHGPPRGALQTVLTICPPACVGILLTNERIFAGLYWWPCVAFGLGLTAVLVMLCGVVLRRIARRAGEVSITAAPTVMPPPIIPMAHLAPPPPMPGAPMLGTPMPQVGMPEFSDSAMPLPPPDQASAAAPAQQPLQYATGAMSRTIGDNPVLWREVRRPLMAKRWQAILGGSLCVIILITTYILFASVDNNNELKDRDLQTGYAVFFNAILMVLVCVVSATAISGEKESDTWTLLLATPLTGGQIVRGKFMGLLRRMAGLWVLIVLHFVGFTLADVISVPTLLVTLWVMFTFNILWVATGLYLSLRVKRTTFAVILNLALPVAAYLLVLAILAIFGEMPNHNGNWADFVGWYAPYPYLVHGIEGLSSTYWYNYWLPYAHQSTRAEFEWAVFIVGVIYLAFTAMILGHSIKRFNQIVGRSGNRKEKPAESPRGGFPVVFPQDGRRQ